MATSTNWYPSPCTNNNCGKTHRTNEDNDRFHPGSYVRIARIGALAIFRTKGLDHSEVLPTPKLQGTHHDEHALNIQLLKVQDDLQASYYCYSTGNFPHTARVLEQKENINCHALEQHIMPQILEHAEGLEEISRGL